jgi:hypothetical protein
MFGPRAWILLRPWVLRPRQPLSLDLIEPQPLAVNCQIVFIIINHISFVKRLIASFLLIRLILKVPKADFLFIENGLCLMGIDTLLWFWSFSKIDLVPRTGHPGL